jgi:hypothetical protein
VSDDLREWEYGDYEGRRTAEIRREVPDPIRAADAGGGPRDGLGSGHVLASGRFCRTQSNGMRCDSSLDSTLGSSTSVMKLPSS